MIDHISTPKTMWFRILIIIFALVFVRGSGQTPVCDPDSAFTTDDRAMLSNGLTNPDYGQVVASGLCACLDFNPILTIADSSLVLTVTLVDHEPVRGIELELHHSAPGIISNRTSEPFTDMDGDSLFDKGEPFIDVNGDGIWSGQLATPGDKLLEAVTATGAPDPMNILLRSSGDYIKVLAFGDSRGRTDGDHIGGEVFTMTYWLPYGKESLPDVVHFWIDNVRIAGSSRTPEILNIVCNYPDSFQPKEFDLRNLATEPAAMLPDRIRLMQNYPNPFNPETVIEFHLPTSMEIVSLELYDVLGRKVISLVEERMESGQHKIVWRGTDFRGRPVSSGIYLYELKAGTIQIRKKMVLLR